MTKNFSLTQKKVKVRISIIFLFGGSNFVWNNLVTPLSNFFCNDEWLFCFNGSSNNRKQTRQTGKNSAGRKNFGSDNKSSG